MKLREAIRKIESEIMENIPVNQESARELFKEALVEGKLITSLVESAMVIFSQKIKNRIVEINEDQALRIIEKRLPVGRFFFYDNSIGKFIGLDNSTSECWVNEFYDKEDCILWLVSPVNSED